MGLFDLFGGFATYNADVGVVQHKGPIESGMLYMHTQEPCSQTMDGFLVKDGNTGETSIRGFNEELMDWDLRVQWVRSEIFPLDISVNRDVMIFILLRMQPPTTLSRS